MPNGFHGSKERWDHFEAALQRLDPELQTFANLNGMILQRSPRNWPSRSLQWGPDVHRTLEVSLEDEDSEYYSVRVSAWQDKNSQRFWKTQTLISSQPMDALHQKLGSLLSEGRQVANSWGPDDLEFAAHLPGKDAFIHQQEKNRRVVYGIVAGLMIVSLFAVWKFFIG